MHSLFLACLVQCVLPTIALKNSTELGAEWLRKVVSRAGSGESGDPDFGIISSGSRRPHKIVVVADNSTGRATIGAWQDGVSVQRTNRLYFELEKGRATTLVLRARGLESWLATVRILCSGSDRGLYVDASPTLALGPEGALSAEATSLHWRLYCHRSDMELLEKNDLIDYETEIALSVITAMAGPSGAPILVHGYIVAKVGALGLRECLRAFVDTNNVEASSHAGLAPQFGLSFVRSLNFTPESEDPNSSAPADCEHKLRLQPIGLQFAGLFELSASLDEVSGLPCGSWVSRNEGGVVRSAGAYCFGSPIALAVNVSMTGQSIVKAIDAQGDAQEFVLTGALVPPLRWGFEGHDGSFVHISYENDWRIKQMRIGVVLGEASYLPRVICVGG